jgi:hypothetical protein
MKRMKINILLAVAFAAGSFICKPAMAQEELLSLLGDIKTKPEKVRNTWKSTRVINGQSSEQLSKGVLDFRILHRFGFINTGPGEVFGLDQASIRLGADYGITEWLSAGFGRSTYKKELDGSVKIKPVWQTKGSRNFPFSVTLVAGMTMNTMKWEDPERKNYFTSKLAYFYEGIIARKFSDGISLQLSPIMVHRNFVDSLVDEHDVWALGIGTRIKISKRVSVNVDYFMLKPGHTADLYTNPLSIGFDIETGGHVFQLHFTNATGMNERAFITETTGDWSKGDIHFGFNISRVFTIGGRKHKS